MSTTTPADNLEDTNSASQEERMRALIDSLSAYIEHFHGGAVKMVDYDGQVLKVRMSGACDGCSLAPVTLHGWVEGTVKQFFPDLEAVEAV
ncbi:MAG: NifU family protein [Ardenticatenaceae bacterium]|nr:NifU family protein [Ardenticatenaceae bacterium]